MCQTLAVSRGGYHSYLKRRLSQRALENKMLVELINIVWDNSKRVYGSPRIHSELKAMGLKINRKRVERLMRENKIVAKTKRKFKVTTNSKHKRPICENLVAKYSPSFFRNFYHLRDALFTRRDHQLIQAKKEPWW